MKKPVIGNMLIAQSGGPSMVINQSLVGAVLEARKHSCIRKIYGSLNGIKGIIEENLVDLRQETPADLLRVAQTPSSALGSTRMKPTPEICASIFTVLKKHNIRYFFYIGGNDSADTTRIIAEEAEKGNFEFRCFHIPKTIDNDLRENDHTPGFGSAARFVAMAMMGDNLDNYALAGVKIDVIMGRHAGFLTAASALARVHKNDGPHLIYLPERPFSLNQFVTDVKGVYGRIGRCLVAVSEGISDRHGVAIASKFTKEKDAHGNVQLSGTGALGDLLAGLIKDKAKISRVRADTFGYLQRSFPAIASPVDSREAFQAGALAVKQSLKTARGSMAIKRKPGRKYGVTYVCVPLANVARETRHVPDEFINHQGNDVTPAFIKYARPLVGNLPAIGRLKNFSVGGR